MKILINGKEHELNCDVACCDDLLKNIGLSRDGLIAEIDGKVFTVPQFSDAVIKDGSKIELIKIMGGG